MQSLDRNLRRELERTIQKARDIAEAAANTALNQLGVGEARAYDYLSEDERALRRRLRVHGRQLGDEREANRVQETIRLLEEVAYEHWHRMLFARFLAENTLLMYPDPDDPVPVTLTECEDLAEMEGLKNGWEVAARYAARMLPQIFREASPVFELTLPPEYQQQMEKLLADLPPEVFTAQDSLGWVYQFWQAKKKKEVNDSEVKIGARELPAVTQLFTEPYMVSFLLDNSLGAWWAARRLSEADLQNATIEAELRQKASIDGVSLDYLRFVRTPQAGDDDEETGAWTPAAGTFDSWPATLAELKTLDPCCGSGHFLVAALLMLAPMRAELESLSPREAVDAVLRDNLHGLELDQRCVEIAAFALALEAWRYPDAGGYRPLPELNLACSGLSIKAAKEEWQNLALGKQNLQFGLRWMYDVFQNAPTLGSLINPARIQNNMIVKWEDIQHAFEQAMATEQDDDRIESGVVAQGMAKAASLLTSKYNWVITNPPYLKRGSQSVQLRDYIDLYHPASRHDLATAFFDRCLDFCIDGGTTSIVLPQNWLFLTSYRDFRKEKLTATTWHILSRLGSGAFETISGEVVKAILVSTSRQANSANSGDMFAQADTSNVIAGIDVAERAGVAEKSNELQNGEITFIDQNRQVSNPDSRIAFDEVGGKLLEKLGLAYIGQRTGDAPRFIQFYWEQSPIKKGWDLFGTTVNDTVEYGGNTQIIFWEEGTGQLAKYQQDLANFRYASGGWKQGWQAWEKYGIRVSQMGSLPVAVHCGPHHDNNTAVIVLKDNKHLSAVWCYCSSAEYHDAVRQIDQSLKVTNATLVKVPFELERWQKIAEERYPNGLPAPYSDDPTQWVFHGHPCGSVVWDEDAKALAHGALRTDETVLQVAVARLLGYRFPAELDSEMELSAESREWVARSAELLSFADKDGIVCIPSVRGERPASERLLNLLAAAYGDDWNNDVLGQLLASVDHAGKTLDTWLRDKFFEQHYKLFNHRPFIWHLWDGLRDGFAVLVNYHRLDYKGLETLIYTYLGDWISRQKSEIAQGVDGAQEKLAAAEVLKKRLEQILTGESPYDIFVRWKPIEEQPVGWQPDLNDGVLLNIRPFMTVQDVSKKGAGVLRSKPNIKWTKDRGKDVETAPWYHLGPEYDGKKGDRINDHHLTLAEKQAARDKRKAKDHATSE